MLLANDGSDFIGLAQTGTGKTAAFGLPLLEMLDGDLGVTQALILAPTRELANQTADQIKLFGKGSSMRIEVIYGGAPIVPQLKALKSNPHLVVATPGRLLDVIKRKALRLDAIQYLVLDEADEMLNMGFKEEIDNILAFTPSEKATWLFSATMPKEIKKIVSRYMTNPHEIAIQPDQLSNTNIDHQYIVTKTADKVPALMRFLDIQSDMRAVMFCRTRRETQEIADELSRKGYAVDAIHGDLQQKQRDSVMRRFKNGSLRLLIATDVAARGIDVSQLTHVVHHSLPDQLEAYTHRSGRTGRAGNKGVSLVFINPRQVGKIGYLEKKLKISFNRIEVPTTEELRYHRLNSWATLIMNTKVDKQAPDIAEHLSQFANISKEELLQRLITSQLDHLDGQLDEEDDLNAVSSDGKQREPKKASTRGIGKARYFINIGMIDGVTRGDLAHFISDVAVIDRSELGSISMQKSFSFFDLKTTPEGFTDRFKGLEIEGRPIRVNLDDNDVKPAGAPKRSNGNKRRSTRKKRYRNR